MVPMSDGRSIPEVRELNLILDLGLRIGEVLLSSGGGAADVTASMQVVAQHLGVQRPEVDVTFTQLSMSYSYDPEEMPITLVRRVKQRDIDYEDLARVNQLVIDIMADRVDLAEARSQMASIVSTRTRFHAGRSPSPTARCVAPSPSSSAAARSSPRSRSLPPW